MFCKDLESVSFYLWWLVAGLTNWKYVSTFKATHLTILISLSLMDNWTTKYYDNSLSDNIGRSDSGEIAHSTNSCLITSW